MHISNWRSACLGLGSALILAACGGADETAATPAAPLKTPVAKLALKTFQADCADFRDYAADALTEQYLAGFHCPPGALCPVYMTDAVGPTAGAPGATAPERVSETNTQEAGVDEADVAKADAAGNLYVLSGRRLAVVAAFPPAGLAERPVASLDLGAADANFYATDFFLDENLERAVILGNSWNGSGGISVSVIVDVSTPSAPVELQRLQVDGWGLDARRIGSRVHRVSRFEVPLPAWFFDGADPLVKKRDDYNAAASAGQESLAQGLRTEIRGLIGQRVEDQGAAFFLPRVTRTPASAATADTRVACDRVSHPEVTAGLGLAVIDSFDADGGQRATSALVNNAYQVYASAENLYLAQSSFGWFFAPRQAEETAIYRLALSATGAAAYRGVGKVDGSVIGPYAFSEHDGALRVASTEWRFVEGRDDSRNHLTVLDATGTDLRPLGALRDLAPGERIRGVRFQGARGYLVTFRQVDPLFALDLSDPAKPVVASELKIPGFSSYLMPLGDSLLLTVGRAGDEQQLNGQVAIQLFDVSDLSRVRQVAVISPAAGDNSYSYSMAEYDPHAFSYFSDSAAAASPGTLSIPLQAYAQTPDERFAGFLVIRVDAGSATPLRELGRIAHNGFAAGPDYCASEGGTAGCRAAIQAAEPRRSVFMQDGAGTYLYTISALGLLASDAADPGVELGRVALPADENSCCVMMPTEPGGG